MILSIVPTRISVQTPRVATPVYAQTEYIEDTTHSSSTLENAVEGEIGTIIACSCIKSVRSFGVPLPYNTNAEDLQGNTTPHINALALFSYENLDHVALIIEINDEGFFVKEGNKIPCEITKRRFVSWDDSSIKGFYDIELDK